MKAIVYDKYGPPEVLHVAEWEKPVPGDGEVRIKAYATSVTRYDCWVRSLTAPPGFKFLMRLVMGKKPKQPILGTELSGVIEHVGKNVSRFEPGDAVMGFSADLKTYAEYICLPENVVVKKPENANFEEAAGFLQGALTALYFLRDANIQPGQKVLIIGASGGVGGYAVQLAKHFYGANVTGVCSEQKMDYVRSLGADHALDYTNEDITQSKEKFDVVFDTYAKANIARTRKVLTENGYYLLSTFGLDKLFQILWFNKTSPQTFKFGTLQDFSQDIVLLKELYEKGVLRSVTDKVFSYQEAAEAHRYVESGQKKGNVIIQFQK